MEQIEGAKPKEKAGFFSNMFGGLTPLPSLSS
jgi:hypothetical protein